MGMGSIAGDAIAVLPELNLLLLMAPTL